LDKLKAHEINSYIRSSFSRKIVVAFSGPDGTGKTSCANFIMKYFTLKHIFTKRVWIKNTHTLAYILVRFLEALSPKRVIRSLSGTFFTHSLACSKIWPWIELVSIIPKLLKIELESIVFKGKIIFVADRFLLDTLVHILMAQRNFNPKRSLPYMIIASFLKKYALTIWLDGDPKLLIKRKQPKADPINYMKFQRLLYFRVVNLLDIPVVYLNTTNKSLSETLEEVSSYIYRIYI